MVGRLAPALPTHFAWLNVKRPLTETDLRGRFVLLDFWTYCCINCMHVLPELKRLEAEFPELLVIGVHSAKFYNEQEIENVRAAIVRYDIEHPVILDEGYEVWRRYEAQGWPTFVLIDPRGRLLWRSSGEGIYEALRPRLLEWREAYREDIHLTPLPLALEKHRLSEGLLFFPGKIAVDEAGGRLFVSDSNHNRIVVLRPEGEVIEVIGSGDEGWRDGGYAEAAFFRPQGLAYAPAEEALYVADTENHLLRRIDLRKKVVSTIAGTGRQARRLYREGPALETPLNSPWDVVWQPGRLWIAMAGFHQLWEMDLSAGKVRVWAGSGWENLQDGHRLVAALAQPSGLTLDPQGRLYFADSESSAIRYVENDTVKTLVGKGLFDFGDADGAFSGALLQHPIGLCWHEGALYVADTYNHKIRRIDLTSRRVETVVGQGRRGHQDGPASQALLNEPNDIKPFRGRYYIADTNNHLLRVWDPKEGVVWTLELQPVERLARPRPARRQSLWTAGEPLPPVSLPPGPHRRVHLHLPPNVELNPEAPSWVQWNDTPLSLRPLSPHTLEVSLPNGGEGRLSIGLYVCRKDQKSLCYLWSYELPVEEGGEASLVEVSLPAK
jgi:sugar lactone lactonase YvrE